MQIIMEGFDGVGCSPGFGPNCKPIFVGRSKWGKVWAPERKPKPKSHYKPKTNSGLGFEVKPIGLIPLGGDFKMPIPSDDTPEKSPEVFLATTTASSVVRHDRLSLASEWPVNRHIGPSPVRSDKANLQLVVQHTSPKVVLLPVTAFEDRQVGFGSVCTGVVEGSSLLPLGSTYRGSSFVGGSLDLAKGSQDFAGW
ncbi:hypothetical protein SLA2020_335270 [Shorea laevis]